MPHSAAISLPANEPEEPARQSPRHLPEVKIENVWQFGPGLYSGGQPEGPTGFQSLADLKIKTIISVDGAAPALDLARKHGMRYVHIPYGYDGIGEKEQLQLVRSMAELPRPIYIHCHHGKHRGPAGAAIMARFGLNWSENDAVAFMKQAGTSQDYAGLYQSVRDFRPPSAQSLAAAARSPLPEQVEVADMVEMMVAIDHQFDLLKAWSKPAQAAAGMPKIDPLHESIQLRELLRESARLPVCLEKPAEFRRQFTQIENDLSQWINHLKSAKIGADDASAKKAALSAIATITARCTACHKAFRDKQ
ncbi:MAG: hypothetical protein ACKO85_08625 [Isosphaeraceae bacterium]